MASAENKSQIIGNLGADPELRYTPKGVPVCNMRVATNKKYKDSNGQLQTRTDWHRVVVWGKIAESCQQNLKKGSQCLVSGELRTREWTDRDQQKRYTTEIHADQVRFLSRPRAKIQASEQQELSMVEDTPEIPF